MSRGITAVCAIISPIFQQMAYRVSEDSPFLLKHKWIRRILVYILYTQLLNVWVAVCGYAMMAAITADIYRRKPFHFVRIWLFFGVYLTLEVCIVGGDGDWLTCRCLPSIWHAGL